MKDLFIVAIIGYCFGNIQTSYWLARIVRKVDIRTLGKGNAGASNTFESLGWKYGVFVAFVDVLKGLLSILLIKNLYQVGLNPQGAFLLYLNGYCVILGHIFPFYMNFKGGKGTASLIGLMMGLNVWFGLAGIAVMVVVTLATQYVAVGTAVLVTFVVVVTVWMDWGVGAITLSLMGAALSLYLHLPNYRRIAKGEESKLFAVLKKKSIKGENQ